MAETAQNTSTLQASAEILDDILTLAELEQPSHCPGLHALRLSGLPLNADDSADGEGDDGEDDGDGDGADGSGDDGDGGSGDGDDDPRVRKANREAAKYRARAKAAEEKLQKADDAKKSEKEKLEERARKAEERATRLEHEGHQRTAAEKAGLPLKYAGRLRGDTEDELLEDAKEMVEDLGVKSDDDRPPAVRRGPQGRKGARGTDMNSLIRRQAGRGR